MSNENQTLTAKRPNPALPGLLGMLLLQAPLTLIALLMLFHTNIDAYLQTRAKSITFIAQLQPGLTSEQTGTLSAALKNSELWRSADIKTLPDIFKDDPAFESWLNDPDTNIILDEIPPVIILQPANPFSKARPADYAADLDRPNLITRFQVDETAFINLRSNHRQIGSNIIIAQIASAVCALILALFFGYTHARLFRLAAVPGSAVRFLTVGLLAASGVLSLIIAAIVWAYLYFATTFAAGFLTPWQIITILIGGVLLSQTAWQLRRLLDRTIASKGHNFHTAATLFPLLLVLLTTTPFAAAQSPALPTPAPPKPALPPSDRSEPYSLSAKTSAERDAKTQTIKNAIKEKKREIQYLRQWLQRTREERALDTRNLTNTSKRLQEAQNALELAQNELQKRQEKIRAIQRSAAQIQTRRLTRITQNDLTKKPKADIATAAIRDTGIQAFHMLKQDRQSIEINRQKVQSLSLELGRLKAFTRYAQSDPDELRDEISRLESQLIRLQSGISILQAKPEPLITPTPAPTPIPALPPSNNTDLGQYIFVPYGTLVHAVSAGTILYAGEFKGLGHLVTIDHSDGFSSHYAYLSGNEIAVRVGDTVQAGQIIGTSGKILRLNNRDGFRFEIRKTGKLVPIQEFDNLTDKNLKALLLGNAN